MEWTLPATVRACFNSVYHQIFQPDFKEIVRYVYVVGGERYRYLLRRSDGEHELLSSRNFLWKNDMYVKDDGIPSLSMYGPTTVQKIIIMMKCPTWRVKYCLKRLTEIQNFKTLSKTDGWEINPNGGVRKNNFPPYFIGQEILDIIRLHPNFDNCSGVIIVPGLVEFSRNTGIIALEDFSQNTGKIKLFDSWFILHGSPTAFYENYHEWYLVFRDCR